jgi:diguanylate cyclase (GGDEF)-like protein
MSDELKARIDLLERELAQERAQIEGLGNLLEKSNNQVFTFYNISKTIASTNDFHEMIHLIMGTLRKSIPFDRASLYLADESRQKLILTYFSGLEITDKTSIGIGEGLPGRIFENGEHSHIHNLSLFYETFNDFIHVPGEEKRDGAYIGVALKSRNTTVGVIGVDCRERQGLSVDDMDFMALTSHQISVGIEKASLFMKTEQLSQLDGLTGLYNHRVFDEKLEQEVSKRSRTGKPLSLIMLDIDHFKKFNDNFGHQEGDAILKELAVVIRGQCRHATMDACFRYGGEEFSVILPELELGIALKIADRMRRMVENHPFRIKEKHPGTDLTVSLGVAGLSGTDDIKPEELLKMADEALYASKRNGRNRVTASPTTAA